MIGIIDYKMGNVGSISNMLKKIGSKNFISSDIEYLKTADKLILPGVGRFDMGMKNLKTAGLDVFLREEVIKNQKPLLGICLGMQLLTNESEEGNELGLGFINAETLHFSKLNLDFKERIPHMGWNSVNLIKKSSITENIFQPSKFYFVHSYFVKANDPSDILMETNYKGIFCSAFERENIFGVQFHPEKSHNYGIKLLSNFVKI